METTCVHRAAAIALMVGLLLPGAAVAEWLLYHEQDFTRAERLDLGFWQPEIGFHRNRERQYYTAANVRLEPGFLRIEARREQVSNAAHQPGSNGWRTATRTARYTSASLVAREPLQYGRIEVVARSPSGAGVWPAIWLVHESAAQYGEIDIFEAVGKHPDTAFAGVHHGRAPRTRQHSSANRVVPGFEGSWRRHTLEWTPTRILVLLDGEALLDIDPQTAVRPGIDPLRQPMRLRINLALGGSWGGPIDEARLPAHFDIASVRIWRWAPGEAATDASPRPTPTAAATDRAPQPAPAAVPTPAPAPAPEGGRRFRWGR